MLSRLKMHIILFLDGLRGCAKKKIQKSENTMEVGGWARAHSEFCCCLENHHKIALNQY